MICLLLEDHPETTERLKAAVLSVYPQAQTLCFTHARDALRWLNGPRDASSERPSLALIDLGLPDGSGVDVIRAIAQTEPACTSLVVTIYNEDSYLFEALRAGAFGYLLKDDELPLLADSIKKAMSGEPTLSPPIARRLLDHFRGQPAQPSTPEENVGLTARQRQTLTLLVRGLSVPEAAAALGLSPQTVASYVKVIYQKLHVTNRAEATREAIRLGLA